ncbi:hypothetical protein NHQ30_007329 [Ciborinia camelliae]|nr:hypothetical protein NHQ30_007329 [Ciborinia camelliae]
MLHHPDKVSSSERTPEQTELFINLKQAYEVLSDPVKRFAYERFGPKVGDWPSKISSMKDHAIHGFYIAVPWYMGVAIFNFFQDISGYMKRGKYWRWVALFLIFVFELHMISRPYFPVVATKVINPILTKFTSHPPYLPFQLMELFQQMLVTLHLAFAQLGPLLESPTASSETGNPEIVLKQQLDRLEQVATAMEADASRLQVLEMVPFANDPHSIKDVKGKVKEWLVQNTIRSDPEVRDAIGNVMRSRNPNWGKG